MKPGDHGDQTPGQRRDTLPPCARCKHPAIYHGRALPHCDACSCAGYARVIDIEDEITGPDR